jgi:hypothetical protein
MFLKPSKSSSKSRALKLPAWRKTLSTVRRFTSAFASPAASASKPTLPAERDTVPSPSRSSSPAATFSIPTAHEAESSIIVSIAGVCPPTPQVRKSATGDSPVAARLNPIGWRARKADVERIEGGNKEDLWLGYILLSLSNSCAVVSEWA